MFGIQTVKLPIALYPWGILLSEAEVYAVLSFSDLLCHCGIPEYLSIVSTTIGRSVYYMSPILMYYVRNYAVQNYLFSVIFFPLKAWISCSAITQYYLH